MTWSCEKFSDYLLGQSFSIESVYKPLIPFLNTKCLNGLPPCVLRFRLRLARFNYTTKHVPGKLLYTADALSWTPAVDTGEILGEKEVETFVNSRDTSSTSKPTATRDLPPSSDQGFCVCSSCGILQTWLALKRRFRPKSQTILENERVFNSMWWPAAVQWKDSGAKSVAERDNEQDTWQAPGYREVSHESQISSLVARNQVVQNCSVCSRTVCHRREPLITTHLPDYYPWQMVGTDLFELKGSHYLLVLDYFSRYPETTKLVSTTSPFVITALKAFSRHGISETVRSDSGPQYLSQ